MTREIELDLIALYRDSAFDADAPDDLLSGLCSLRAVRSARRDKLGGVALSGVMMAGLAIALTLVGGGGGHRDHVQPAGVLTSTNSVSSSPIEVCVPKDNVLVTPTPGPSISGVYSVLCTESGGPAAEATNTNPLPRTSSLPASTSANAPSPGRNANH